MTLLEKLKITDVVIGTGKEVVKGALVICQYVGKFSDGKTFDSSYVRGRPFQFVIGSKRVIQGWDLGVMGMREGGKRELEVPAGLGYGSRSMALVPPNSDLYFEIEVLEVRLRDE